MLATLPPEGANVGYAPARRAAGYGRPKCFLLLIDLALRKSSGYTRYVDDVWLLIRGSRRRILLRSAWATRRGRRLWSQSGAI